MERLALVLLAGCWTGGGARAAAPEPEPRREQPALEISLERGPCFGPCSVFKLAIRGDGRVDWAGKEHVAATGKRTRWIARADVEELERELETARFFVRDQHGHIPREPSCVRRGNTRSCTFTSHTFCSDTSHTILTVRRGHRTHRIDNAHCEGEDAALAELERRILERAGAAEWIGLD